MFLIKIYIIFVLLGVAWYFFSQWRTGYRRRDDIFIAVENLLLAISWIVYGIVQHYWPFTEWDILIDFMIALLLNFVIVRRMGKKQGKK